MTPARCWTRDCAPAVSSPVTADPHNVAREMYKAGAYSGVSWWSYHEHRWASYAIWDHAGLSVAAYLSL